MPIRRNKPVASSSALALIQEAAVDKPIIPAPNSLPTSQKDLCLREVKKLMPTSIAMYRARKTRNS
jgi:hypothetical protein